MGKNRRLAAGLAGVLLVLLLVDAGRMAWADNDIVIELNGEALQLAPEPLLKDDRVYAPVGSLNCLAEALGETVYWEPLNGELWLLHGGEAAAHSFNYDDGIDENYELTAADGTVYMPLEQLAELFDLEYEFDRQENVVRLGSLQDVNSLNSPDEQGEPIRVNLDEAAAAGADVVWLKQGGTYEISGRLAAGRIRIQTGAPVRLLLAGCELNAQGSSSAIYAEGGGLVQIEAVGEAPSYLHSLAGAAIAVDGGLELGGEGSLELSSEGGPGISAGSYVRLNGSGDIRIRAAAEGIRAGELAAADSGRLEITAGGAGLSAGGLVFLNGGELTIPEAKWGISSGHIISMNGGNLNITAAEAGLRAGAPGQNIQTAYIVRINQQTEADKTDKTDKTDKVDWYGNETVVVTLGNEANGTSEEDNFLANIASGELDKEQHIAINGGELIVNAGLAALVSQGSIEQQGGVAVLYAGRERALAAGGVVLYDGGTLLAADGGGTQGVSALNSCSGGSWLDIDLRLQLEALVAGSEIVVADKAGQALWSYQAGGEVGHLLFADSALEPEEEYQVLLNGEPAIWACAE